MRDHQDRQTWQEFVDLYGSIVYQFGCQRGMQDADAADFTQIVMQQSAGTLSRFDYDEDAGTFHLRLFTAARNHLYEILKRQNRQIQGSGATAAQQRLEATPTIAEDSAVWEREFRRRRFLWAVNQVPEYFAENSWQAFWQTAIEG